MFGALNLNSRQSDGSRLDETPFHSSKEGEKPRLAVLEVLLPQPDSLVPQGTLFRQRRLFPSLESLSQNCHLTRFHSRSDVSRNYPTSLEPP